MAQCNEKAFELEVGAILVILELFSVFSRPLNFQACILSLHFTILFSVDYKFVNCANEIDYSLMHFKFLNIYIYR